jgi:hypothetical protein
LVTEDTEKPRLSGAFYGADDGDRTRDPQLGKLMLYQLSYVRSMRPKIAQSVLKFGAGTADENGKREIGHPRR